MPRKKASAPYWGPAGQYRAAIRSDGHFVVEVNRGPAGWITKGDYGTTPHRARQAAWNAFQFYKGFPTFKAVKDLPKGWPEEPA